MRTKLKMFGIAALAGAALVACDDGDDITGLPDGEASFQVLLQSDGAATSTTMSMVGPNMATLSLSAVESIVLPVGAVEAQEDGGAWVEAGRVDDDIDLLDLPVDGIVLVDGSLPEGDYTRLRFFLTDDPTITLSESITVGRTTFEAGPHPLRIPSVEQAGFRVNADFEVDGDGETITMIFDDDASVGRVTATGSGVLKIAPVFTVRDDDGEDVGDFDDDEDDDDTDDEEFEGIVASVGESSLTLESGLVVVIDGETEFDGDLLSLDAVADAVANVGERVEVEGEGTLQGDGSILADEIEFEIEEIEAEEVEGAVTGMDEGSLSFTLLDDDTDTEVTVQLDGDTEFHGEGDADTFAEALALFDDGLSLEAEAEGFVDGDGVFQADRVKFEVEDEDETSGQVVSTDEDAMTFVVLDSETDEEVTVLLTETTVIDVEGDLDTFAEVVAAVVAGTTVRAEADGQINVDGVLEARIVKFETD